MCSPSFRISPAYVATAFLSLITVFLVQTLTAQDVSEDSRNPAEAVATTPDTVAVENVSDDSKIAQRLQSILESTGWFEGIVVTSQHGFVQIDGTTDSDEHSAWAENIAARTTDVIGVSNNLDVKSQVNFQGSMVIVAESLKKQYRDFLVQLPFFIAGLIVLLLTVLASRLVSFAISRLIESRTRMRSSLKDLIKQLSSISVWIIGLLLATVVVFPGMTPSRALTVLGLGSVAIGFAFKDIFENFFAGVLILWRYPIEKGDFIECGSVIGKVEEITIRNTMLRRMDGELVVVPNGQIFKSNVEVLTNRPKRRVRIVCGVAYKENVDSAREVIRDAVAACESVSGPKSVEILANEFGDSSVNFEVAWWTGATPLQVRESRDEVIASIKTALNRAGIEIPFPYRTLTFAHPLSIENGPVVEKDM